MAEGDQARGTGQTYGEMLETLHSKQRANGEAMAALQNRVREVEDRLLESREQWKELKGKLEADRIAAWKRSAGYGRIYLSMPTGTATAFRRG